MKKEKILIWDLESLPAKGYFWAIHDTSVPLQFIEEVPSVISIAYKWLGEKKTHCISIADNKKRFMKNVYDDSEVMKRFAEVYEQADMTVAHFGTGFDKKFIQGRAFVNKLKPIPDTKIIDTCLLGRKKFKLLSHKLDHYAQLLKIRGKDSTNAGLWRSVIDKDLKKVQYMVKYNIQDVDLLEKVFLEMRPYINIGLRSSLTECPKCGSDKVTKRGSFRTANEKKQRYQCQDCGGWSNQSTKDTHKEI